jgi:hypothetical protein
LLHSFCTKPAVESVTSSGSRPTKITIGYKSQFWLRPHDTLPVLDRAQGVSADLLASPLLTPQPISFEHVYSPGGPASVEAGVVGVWRGQEASCAHLRDAPRWRLQWNGLCATICGSCTRTLI